MRAGGKTEESDRLRQIVFCPVCEVQYDASGVECGDLFHCGCGQALEVPKLRSHQSEVVRCSSCGAPRSGNRMSCSFCSADFTLHERDLHTICPKCLTRISDKARFCHHCGTAITPHRVGRLPSDRVCPVCPERPLVARTIGDEISMLECGRCGGVWLGHELFELLQEKARTEELPWVQQRRNGNSATPHYGPMYRRCVVCSKQMNRRNFGRGSGVVIDSCPTDGLWLDLGELERILAWIREGGPAKAREREEARRKSEQFSKQLKQLTDPVERQGLDEDWGSEEPFFVRSIVDFLTG